MAAELLNAMNAPGNDLAAAALTIARVEYPCLDPQPYLAVLDRMGQEAAARMQDAGDDSVRAFNEYLYDEQGFTGNRDHYDDPRNSFINEVLDRRTGIPISSDASTEAFIIDPFHGGAQLSEYDCRQLLRQHVGDEAAFDSTLLAPATRHDIIVRMLVNLKRLYVRMRSFPQARFMSSLLLGIDPSAISELRDRGLLAYHLQDFSGALRDLEEYLRLSPKSSDADEHDVFADQGDVEAEDDEPTRTGFAQFFDARRTVRQPQESLPAPPESRARYRDDMDALEDIVRQPG